MVKLTDEQREAYIYFSQFHKNEGAFARHLVDALRRAVAEVLRLEFETGYYVNDFGTDTEFCIHDTHVVNLTPCTDPCHEYTEADWEREADRVIREGR